jgi:hypothetical protein
VRILPYYSQGQLTSRQKKKVIPYVSRVEKKSDNKNNSNETAQQILAKYTFTPSCMGYFLACEILFWFKQFGV